MGNGRRQEGKMGRNSQGRQSAERADGRRGGFDILHALFVFKWHVLAGKRCPLLSEPDGINKIPP